MEALLNEIKQKKIIAILRGLTVQEAVNTVRALHAGGIDLVEVTFNQKNERCIEETVASLEAIADLKLPIHYGTGTVLSVEQVEAAKAVGAEFIISPNVDEAVIKRTAARNMLSLPGAMSPSEIVDAYQYGAHMVKVFPAGNLGSAYIKAIRAPISYIPLVAVGGVSIDNMREFYEAGICGFGIGGCLVDRKLIKAGDFEGLTKLARSYTDLAASLK